MSFSIFMSFDGDCQEAVMYYAGVFGKDTPKMMRYSDMPERDTAQLSVDDKNRIMIASMDIFGTEIMFADAPKNFKHVVGNNISPVLSLNDRCQVESLFNALKVGGSVSMELQQTFWSPLYGMVEDRYGIIWQLSYDDGR